MTIFDMPLRYRKFTAKERDARIMKALEQVGLAGRKNHYPTQLSGGQQQTRCDCPCNSRLT